MAIFNADLSLRSADFAAVTRATLAEEPDPCLEQATAILAERYDLPPDGARRRLHDAAARAGIGPAQLAEGLLALDSRRSGTEPGPDGAKRSPDPAVSTYPADVTEEQGRLAQQRATEAKDRELLAHERAERMHEEAAVLQDRLGRHDKAQAARQRAEHAREQTETAKAEREEAEQYLDPGSDQP